MPFFKGDLTLSIKIILDVKGLLWSSNSSGFKNMNFSFFIPKSQCCLSYQDFTISSAKCFKAFLEINVA
jgi:hypothetical protein